MSMRVTQMTKLMPNATILDLTENVLTQTSSIFTKNGTANGYITITTRVDDVDSETEESTASKEFSEETHNKSNEFAPIELNLDVETINKNNREISRHIRIKDEVNNKVFPFPIEIIKQQDNHLEVKNQITNVQGSSKKSESLVVYPLQYVWCGKKFLKDDWEL